MTKSEKANAEDTKVKFLDYIGLQHFWGKTKGYIDHFDATKVDKTTTVNGKGLDQNITLDGTNLLVGNGKQTQHTYAGDSVADAIEKLDAAVKTAASAGVTSFGGQTGAITLKTTSSTNGAVNLKMGDGNKKNELQASIVGLGTAAYETKESFVPSSRTVNEQQLNQNITLTGVNINTGNSTESDPKNTYASKSIANSIDLLDKAVKAADAKGGVTSIATKTGAFTFASATEDGTIQLDVDTKNVISATINGLGDCAFIDTGAGITVGGSGQYNNTNIAAAIDSLHNDIRDAAAKAGVQSIGNAKGIIGIGTGSTKSGEVNFTMDGTAGAGGIITNGTLKGTVYGMDGKADKTDALKNITGSASGGASNVQITITKTPITGNTSTSTINIPAATTSAHGTVTLKQITDAAAAAATSTYKVKGSKDTIEEVLALTNAKVGDVWNIVNAFNFGGKPHPAGTNVVCKKDTSASEHTEANWDPLGGTVDLSGYAKKDEVVTSFSGQTGAITLKAASSTNGDVNLKMSGNELQASVVGLDGAAYKAEDYYALKDHDHAIADITNLQTTLDGKVPNTRTINGEKLDQNITLTGVNINTGSDGTYKGTIKDAIEGLDAAIGGAASAGVTSFSGLTGAITIDKIGSTGDEGKGSVNFKMDGQMLVGDITPIDDNAINKLFEGLYTPSPVPAK